MGAAVILLMGVPLLAAAVPLLAPHRVSAAVTAGAGAVSLALALALVPAAAAGPVRVGGFLRADALSVVFLLATAFLYAATALYSSGYLAAEARAARAAGGEELAAFAAYSRRYHIGLNVFAWSMLCAPLVDGLALLWVAVEVTTVVSALLVAIDNTEGATEAAWKYVLIASSGLGIALLATIVMYYAGSQPLGPSYDLAFDPLLRAARSLPATPVQLAFVLAVVGYGTKVGLFPVHTWLPDAHSEAPTPVSALLSGALLATSFYAIVRYYQIAAGTLGAGWPAQVLAVFGLASLLLAALYLLQQGNLKRMLAYSSIEHMGILAVGLSFGAPLALSGVLLHVLAHAAAKGAAFMGAGAIVRVYGTKDLDRIRDAARVLPWSGPLFLAAVLALSAAPPFGIFRSEFLIVAGGLQDPGNAAAVLLVVLLTLAFFGLAAATTDALFRPASAIPSPAPGEPGPAMVVPVAAALAVLVLLGVHPPEALSALLDQAVRELQVAR
ncbi:proton-conducting transporter transmembrane domain-containing protein [Sinomonas sp.]|jgi:hydrogenase-4 component F|uniref:proton-conducting transporter transmembrane domain-containing protein n=1 Tax=Sinomonas sp. TaxID=1914986 RepID=UPI002FE3C412